MKTQTENEREGLLKRITRILAWPQEKQYEHQLEYGISQWVADTSMTIESFPQYSRRAKDLFGNFDDLLFNSGLGSWGVYSGHRFVRTFGVSTEYPIAISYRQKRQSCEPDLGDQVTHWIIGEHRDEPNIEVTLRALMQNDNKNPSGERAWEFMLGLNYNGNDREFRPVKVKVPTLWKTLNYRLRGIQLEDNKLRTEKMSLLLQTYGATIRQRGVQLLDEKVAESNAELEIKDERLKPHAEKIFTLINSCERNCDRGEKTEVVNIVNGYKSEGERFGGLANQAEEKGDFASAAEYLLERERQIGIAEHIVDGFIDQRYTHRHQRSYENSKRDKKRLVNLFEQARKPEMAEWFYRFVLSEFQKAEEIRKTIEQRGGYEWSDKLCRYVKC